MNPEAEKLWSAMWHCRGLDQDRRYLQDNADTVAEIVDAAIALHEENNRPGGWLTAAEERLARAVADFKGPQHPDPKIERMEVLRCPSPECGWWNAREDDGPASYHDHRRLVHGEVRQ